MITVLASITVKEHMMAEFIEIFKANIAAVIAEPGCFEYYPTIDLETPLPIQDKNPAVITIIEKWQDIEALHTHLAMPHMLEYKDKTKDMVEDISIKILQNA